MYCIPWRSCTQTKTAFDGKTEDTIGTSVNIRAGHPCRQKPSLQRPSYKTTANQLSNNHLMISLVLICQSYELTSLIMLLKQSYELTCITMLLKQSFFMLTATGVGILQEDTFTGVCHRNIILDETLHLEKS